MLSVSGSRRHGSAAGVTTSTPLRPSRRLTGPSSVSSYWMVLALTWAGFGIAPASIHGVDSGFVARMSMTAASEADSAPERRPT